MIAAVEKKTPETETGLCETTLTSIGEKEAAKIISHWRDNDDAGLNDAAFRFGQLVSADMLTPSHARKILEFRMGVRRYPPASATLGEGSFGAGRSSQATPEDFLMKAAANDNEGEGHRQKATGRCHVAATGYGPYTPRDRRATVASAFAAGGGGNGVER
jgi:hypothetical protein